MSALPTDQKPTTAIASATPSAIAHTPVFHLRYAMV